MRSATSYIPPTAEGRGAIDVAPRDSKALRGSCVSESTGGVLSSWVGGLWLRRESDSDSEEGMAEPAVQGAAGICAHS